MWLQGHRNWLVLVMCFIAVSAESEDTVEQDAEPSKDVARDFSFFTIVTFQNVECTLVTRSPLRGVCFPSSECSDRGGTADGNCASGFGVCCQFTARACGSTVSQNCTYIQNPAFPSNEDAIGTTVSNCQYNIDSPENICQLRLDFNSFQISPSLAASGNCNTDDFTVTSPTGREVPVICGINSGQHMYIETARSATDTTLAFRYNQATPTANTRMYNIKVSQIPCDAPYRAPNGCLQYFTSNTGTVTSFGHGGTTPILPNSANYLSCIRQNEGMCQITWLSDPNVPNTFRLMNGGIGVIIAINSLAATACTMGFVTIPGANVNPPRFCGATFNQGDGTATPEAIISQSPPFVIQTFRASSSINTNILGYSLMYVQGGC